MEKVVRIIQSKTFKDVQIRFQYQNCIIDLTGVTKRKCNTLDYE